MKEVVSVEASLKRFALTKEGEEQLREYDRRREVFRRKFHSIRKILLKIHMEMDEESYQSSVRLFESTERISPHLERKGREALPRRCVQSSSRQLIRSRI